MPEKTTRPRSRKKDVVLEGAVEIARQAAEDVARPGTVGEHVGIRVDGDRLLTHLFDNLDPGYRGWTWAVTVARVPRGRKATICEVDLIPGDDSLLAPPWVPWAERLTPDDLSRSDVLPYRADDERLDQSYEDAGENPDLPTTRELGLGRARILSTEGRRSASERWYHSQQGPARGRLARNPCSTCGFLVKLPGEFRTVFGVCANEWAQDDGKVVSLDHACGAHSETDTPNRKTQWPVRPSHVNDFGVETVELGQANQAGLPRQFVPVTRP